MHTSQEKIQEAVDWVHLCGGQRAAARESGIPRSTLQYRMDLATQQGVKPSGADPRLDRLTEKQAETSEEMGIPAAQLKHGWQKTDTGSYFFKVPGAGDSPTDAAEAIKAALADLPRLRPRKPLQFASEHLQAKLPIFDAHIGMFSHEEVTGEEWSTQKAVDRLSDGISDLVTAAPACGSCLLIFGGDTTHQDDSRNRTPGHGHYLDVGEAYHRTIQAAVRAARNAVDLALARFNIVKVKVLRGNHDVHAHIALTVALAAQFEMEPRVQIDTTFGDYFQDTFGLNFNLYHHGDKGDATRLVLFAADHYAKAWGTTKHRNIYTGHVHHDAVKDIGGARWASMRTMAPKDAYAHNSAYSSRQTLRLQVDDQEFGEIQTHSVNF